MAIEIEKKQAFKYRGKTVEELKALDIREFAKLLPSREKRSVLRGFREIEDFVRRCEVKISKKKPIKTHYRDLVIVPKMIGMKIFVYNGQEFNPVEITGEMLGTRLGEYSHTRGKVSHGAAGVGATRGSRSRSVK
jgi:small subunit ribosomal protein S19